MRLRPAMAGLLALLASAGLAACGAAVPGAPPSAPAPALARGGADNAAQAARSAPAPAYASPSALALSAANVTSLQSLGGGIGAAKPPPPPPKVLPRRGIGEYGPNVPNELQVYSQNGLTWYYDWTLYSDPASLNVARTYNTEYVPMVWGNMSLQNMAPALNKRPYQKGSYFPTNTQYLLGFNEPNKDGQANLTAMQAAQLWPQVVAVANNFGLKLGSPAPAHCGQPNCLSPKQAPFDWLDDFFSNCTAMYGKPCQADIMAVHYYGCTTADLQTFMAQVAQKYNRPIWLTEFACGGAGTYDQIAQVMQSQLTMLDNQPMVDRYNWFASHTQGTFLGPLASLMQNSYSKAKLSPLGKLYTSFKSKIGSAAPLQLQDPNSALHDHIQADVCSTCSEAAADASVVIPDLNLRTLCIEHCGFKF